MSAGAGRAASLFALVLALGACAAARVPMSEFSLAPPLPPAAAPATVEPGVLGVEPIEAAPGYDTSAMLYIARPLELGRFAAHRWVDTPARMLLGPLVESLAARGRWQAVVALPAIARVQWRLRLSGLRLQQEVDTAPGQIRLGVRAEIADAATRRLAGARTFEVVEPLGDDGPDHGAAAANRAAARLFDDIGAWAAGVVP
ncbi:MAG: ABC-type transport auxiliary lipoprotein family protein [Gammaproteobacteria bacterium]